VFYTYGLMRAMLYWKDQEAKNRALHKITEIFNKATENVSQEIYKGWAAAFINLIAKTDYRLVKPFVDAILKNPFESKSPNIQMKYLSLYDAVIKYHAPFAQDLTNNLIDNLMNFRPQNIRQVFLIFQFLKF
jgi:hypothetical protein